MADQKRNEKKPKQKVVAPAAPAAAQPKDAGTKDKGKFAPPIKKR